MAERTKSSKSVRNGAKKAASKEKPQLESKRIRVTKSTVILIITRFKREKKKMLKKVRFMLCDGNSYSSRLVLNAIYCGLLRCLSLSTGLEPYYRIERERPLFLLPRSASTSLATSWSERGLQVKAAEGTACLATSFLGK